MSTVPKNEKRFLPLIGILSVAIPIVVALLLYAPRPEVPFLKDLTFLPLLNAVINSTVAIVLVLGFVFIRSGKVTLHRTMMLSALVLSALFLISYVTYHYGHGEVKYHGKGLVKAVYLLILFSHIVLSVAVVPLALISVFRGLSGLNDKHRKIARITLPVWLYVAVTGVIVYLMAHPFNPVLN